MDESLRSQLIERASNGDTNALQAIIVHYHGAISSIVKSRIGRSAGRLVDPEDVLQETYVAAFQTITGLKFANPAAFFSWLKRIALNCIVDQQRAAARQKRTPPGGGHVIEESDSRYGLLGALAAPDSTPSRHARKAEAMGAVLAGLARLCEDQRKVIRLRFVDGLTASEVADRIGRSEDAVHALSRRGLNSLRKFIGSLTDFLSHL